jgi:hypothetical protein
MSRVAAKIFWPIFDPREHNDGSTRRGPGKLTANWPKNAEIAEFCLAANLRSRHIHRRLRNRLSRSLHLPRSRGLTRLNFRTKADSG